MVEVLYANKLQVRADAVEDEEEAEEHCVDVQSDCEEFESIGYTPPGTNFPHGFYTVLAFKTSEDYDEWKEEQLQ
jgi:hypothetical protein